MSLIPSSTHSKTTSLINICFDTMVFKVCCSKENINKLSWNTCLSCPTCVVTVVYRGHVEHRSKECRCKGKNNFFRTLVRVFRHVHTSVIYKCRTLICICHRDILNPIGCPYFIGLVHKRFYLSSDFAQVDFVYPVILHKFYYCWLKSWETIHLNWLFYLSLVNWFFMVRSIKVFNWFNFSHTHPVIPFFFKQGN
jgi:hypothetical protein